HLFYAKNQISIPRHEEDHLQYRNAIQEKRKVTEQGDEQYDDPEIMLMLEVSLVQESVPKERNPDDEQQKYPYPQPARSCECQYCGECGAWLCAYCTEVRYRL